MDKKRTLESSLKRLPWSVYPILENSTTVYCIIKTKNLKIIMENSVICISIISLESVYIFLFMWPLFWYNPASLLRCYDNSTLACLPVAFHLFSMEHPRGIFVCLFLCLMQGKMNMKLLYLKASNNLPPALGIKTKTS